MASHFLLFLWTMLTLQLLQAFQMLHISPHTSSHAPSIIHHDVLNHRMSLHMVSTGRARKPSNGRPTSRKPTSSATSKSKGSINPSRKSKPNNHRQRPLQSPIRRGSSTGTVVGYVDEEETPAKTSSTAASASTKARGKVLTAQNIFGQNVVTCRNFKLDSAKSFSFLGSYNNLLNMPSYPVPEIAFVGRSNVGKSSLLNAISGMHKSIAVEGKQPGRTQLMNHFLCGDSDGDICIFTDLPGYGFAKISKESQEQISRFVNDYLRNRGSLKLTCLLVDARREPQEADMKMIEFLHEVGGNYLVIATKVDKLSKHEADVSLQRLQNTFQLPSNMPIRFSAVTGEGKRPVWHAIKDAMLDEGIYAYEGAEEEEEEEDYDDEDEEDDNDEDSYNYADDE